jgi:hypothetical protein
MKNDAVGSNVFLSDKYRPTFKAAKDKFENANSSEDPKFDQADVDAIKE